LIDLLEKIRIFAVIVVVPVIDDIALALMTPLKEVILIVADTESVTGVIETETGTETETQTGTEIVIEKGRKIELVTVTLNAVIALMRTWTMTGTATARGSVAGVGIAPKNHAPAIWMEGSPNARGDSKKQRAKTGVAVLIAAVLVIALMSPLGHPHGGPRVLI